MTTPTTGPTPWKPSRRAAARVKNPLPAPTTHDVCGGPVGIVHHDQVYGRPYSDWPWMYRCSTCGASTGMHPFTSIPLGTLADRALRTQRKECKQPFEVVWQSGRMSRDEAYQALAKHLAIPLESCHFGWFDSATCNKARAWAVAELRKPRPRYVA